MLEKSQSSLLKKQGDISTLDVNLTESTKSEEIGLTPTKKDRKKFDIDLAYGKVFEEKIIEMLQDKKIEVKTERGMWTPR